MSTTNELTALVDKIVTEKTFSMETLPAINALRECALQLEDLRVQSDKRVDELNKQLIKSEEQRLALGRSNSEWDKRKTELEKREARISDLEKREAVAIAESDSIRFAFSAVFANRTARETVQRWRAVRRIEFEDGQVWEAAP